MKKHTMFEKKKEKKGKFIFYSNTNHKKHTMFEKKRKKGKFIFYSNTNHKKHTMFEKKKEKKASLFFYSDTKPASLKQSAPSHVAHNQYLEDNVLKSAINSDICYWAQHRSKGWFFGKNLCYWAELHSQLSAVFCKQNTSREVIECYQQLKALYNLKKSME